MTYKSPEWSSCSQCRHHTLEEHGSQLWDVCRLHGFINAATAWHCCADQWAKWVKNHEALMR